ncbi:MAG: branched-chain amino acid ABC transporter permease [Chloroflexi bacterium]|nr:MAG: branched-chain amino acid ABC transporter permease [Chloroflexota bacterium]
MANANHRPNPLMTTLKSNWFYVALVLFLIVFPHLIGWLTGEGPFGIQRGRRFMVIGQSVTQQLALAQVFIFGILAMSYNLMFGFSGVISFGHALFFGAGGYTLGILMEKAGLDPTTGFILGVVLGIVLAGGLSFIIGLVSLRLRGVYFAVFTLAIAESFAIYFSRFQPTGAEDGFTIRSLPEWIDPTRNPLTFYYIALAGVVLTFFFIRRLMHSPTGAIFLAIRENEQRALAIGYNTLVYKVLAITVAGMMASGAGMLHVILNSKKIGPQLLGVNFTVEPLLGTIIGGTGTFTGPVIGAAGLFLGERALRGAQLPLSTLFVGAVILMLVLAWLAYRHYRQHQTWRSYYTMGALLVLLALVIMLGVWAQQGDIVVDIGSSWEVLLGISFVLVVMVFPLGVVGTWTRWRLNRKLKPEQNPILRAAAGD